MPQALSRDVMQPILSFWEDIDTPQSLACAMLARYGEWDQLVLRRSDPARYADPRSFFKDNLATAILSKCRGLPTTTDLRAAAVKSFFDSERACYLSNERLSPLVHDDYSSVPEGVRLIVSTARKYLAHLLGPCPDLPPGRFGPGATYGDKGRLTTVPDKMSTRPTLTSGAYPFLFQWSGTQWASACSDASRPPLFVRGNRFTTVPKDSKKDRGICIEPSINLFYQLGYGSVIKSRLLTNAGVNLSLSQDLHRQVVCDASSQGHLATIDLSSASDTVCKNLVKLLLPERWFSALDDLRSPSTFIEGKWVYLEKFSSMGNGYTFELETVIFQSLVFSLMTHLGFLPREGKNLFVFGDDIIVPTDVASDVCAMLSYFGFTVNKDKTFITGSFRESCGADFFLGKSVRPFFLKELPHEPQHFIAWANGIRRVCRDHFSGNRYCDSLFRRSWFGILDAIPSAIRACRGPEFLGDLVIHDEPDRWQTRRRNQISYCRVYRPARYRWVEWKHFRPAVVLATATYGTGNGERGVLPRDSVAGFKVGWSAIP